MATTALAVQTMSRNGLEATYSAAVAGDGHAFDNDGRNVFLHVKNDDAADKTISIATPASPDGLAVPTKDIVVTAGEERFIGPFPQFYEYNDGDNNIERAIQVTYSATTSVTVAAVKLPGASLT